MINLRPAHLLPVGFGSFVEMLRLELLHWPDAGIFSTNFHDLNLKNDPLIHHVCLQSQNLSYLVLIETIVLKPGSEPRLLTYFKTVASVGCTVYKKLEELIFTKTANMRIAYCLLPAAPLHHGYLQ